MSNQFKFLGICGFLTLLTSCTDVSYVQTESPNIAYKDYATENTNHNAILGVGDPVSKSQMRANALLSFQGRQNLEQTMFRLAKTYNVAVRWGNGVRKSQNENILMKDLTFNEARTYIEDVYNVQIIREGERRLLILPSASEPKVTEFAPGRNVTLSQAVNGLAEQCGFNLVIAENKARLAETRITTTLRNVTCYDAFAALLNPHGMSLEDRGSFYSIGGLPVRRWTLDLHEPDRDDEREVTYSSSFSGSNEESGNEQELGGSSKVSIKSERRLWEKLDEDLNALLDNICAEYQQAMASGASAAGDSLLLPPTDGTAEVSADLFNAPATSALTTGGEETCGYVRINPAVGLVQMRGPQIALDEADEIIRKVEDIAGRRLMLEARVLAVKRERNFEQGGQIGLTSVQTAEFGPTSISAAVTQALVDLGTTQPGLGAGISVGDLTAAVRIVESFGTTYQLMQPTIELMDRQQATLIDGTSEPFIVRSVESETTETGTLTNISNELKYQFLGMQFSATAQIADEGDPHTVSIQIPILSKTGDFSVPIYAGTEVIGQDNIPIAETRLIDQKVRLRDGEIKVIGGLTKTVAIDQETGVPLLREIPLAGKTMGGEDISYENVEFVVLLQARRIY